MYRCSRIVEYRGMYKVLRDDSVALVAREEMFFVNVKSLDNLDGRLFVKWEWTILATSILKRSLSFNIENLLKNLVGISSEEPPPIVLQLYFGGI